METMPSYYHLTFKVAARCYILCRIKRRVQVKLYKQFTVWLCSSHNQAELVTLSIALRRSKWLQIQVE